MTEVVERPVHLPDGAVQVPGFRLPVSSFVSAEAAAAMRRRADQARFEGVSAPTLEAMRQAAEMAVAPHLEAARRRYPVTIEETSIAGVAVRDVRPASGPVDAERVLINLHGGAFMVCADACALVESIPIAVVGGFRVITVDYRQGPEHLFPAASQDVAAVFSSLAETYAPASIGIFGCSAGGSLTAQVTAWLLNESTPLPGAIGIFGAGATRFGSGDSAHIAAYIDGAFPPPDSDGHLFPTPYFRGADMDSALISPALHPEVLSRFPPTLLLTGTRAMDMSPAIYTHYQLLKTGAESDLIIGEGLGHCYLYNPELPESRELYDMIVRFFKSKLA